MKISHTKITASVNTGLNYWYKFKHGLGPGTMPSDCNVIKVIDDGWKDYVLLDRMLTTQELNEYEIKEEVPPVELLQENGYSSVEETYQDVTSADDMWSDTASRYYVTPEITEFDIDFAAEAVARHLKSRGADPITTEDVIDTLRFISDKWDEYWGYGLKTEEDAKVFLDNFLARLRDYGIDNVVDNTFASIQCAGEVRMSDGTASNYQSFMAWYNSLTNYQKIGVDDYADEQGYPAYEDCTFGMLAKMKREFEEAEDGEDEWAMPKGVYHVAAFGNDFDELQSSFDFKDPKLAILKWVQLQQKWPTNVMITGFQEEEENLRNYVTSHPDWYRQISAKFNCPYDAEYIISECAKPVRPRTGTYANKYTDQCHPFGLG